MRANAIEAGLKGALVGGACGAVISDILQFDRTEGIVVGAVALGLECLVGVLLYNRAQKP